MTDWRLERDAALLAFEQAKTADERAAAASRLCDLAADDPRRGSELIASLPRLLDDADPDVRALGVTLAALSIDPEPLHPILAARLEDADEHVRIEAAGRLADLVLPQARGSLARALADEHFSVRFEAARGMAALHHGSGLEVLVEALERGELRFRALGALAELGDPRALPAVKRVFNRWLLPGFERTQAAGVLAKLGDPSGIAHLFKRTGRWWKPDRALAAELLGVVKAPGAYEHLAKIVVSKKDPHRGPAARGLGRLGDPRCVPLLLPLLEDPTLPEDLRLDAAEGLCFSRAPGARDRVRQALPTFSTLEARAEVEALLEELEPTGDTR